MERALPFMFGDSWVSGNTFADIANTKLVVFSGNNPAETRMSGGGLVNDLVRYRKKNGTKFIVIDPIHTDTAAIVADEWIPMRPGTDAALASAIAYILITEDFVDLDFLRRCTVGYDESSIISVFTWTDAIDRCGEMTAKRDGVQGGIAFSRRSNSSGTMQATASSVNGTHKILQDETKCESIVVIDNFLTPSARYADYLLPAAITAEEIDFVPNGYTADMAYVIFANKVLEPYFESLTSGLFRQHVLHWRNPVRPADVSWLARC